ncbi:crAss001_48 related protein [Burkholderia vietnamiensis]|uniref:crAss001_48 related protein n=1 Tax=Burkholderia vietnamiensis TaxID=60552 RepID=UPI001CF4F50D|nr:hypothetical protein [Burkholderia vietnamiensis]MCA7945580.1 hypothetical protein [Burkholderia vietnamiensis]
MNTLAPHQQRVVDERAELDERLKKLIQFSGGPVFAGLPEEERFRLNAQMQAMALYSVILGDRIAAFQAPAPSAEVYSHPECRFNYCASPGVCKGADRCANT